MAQSSYTFTLTPDELSARVQQLAADGVTVTLPTGTIERDTWLGHVKLAYAWHQDAGLLLVQVEQCPRLARGKVENMIKGWFGEGQ